MQQHMLQGGIIEVTNQANAMLVTGKWKIVPGSVYITSTEQVAGLYSSERTPAGTRFEQHMVCVLEKVEQ